MGLQLSSLVFVVVLVQHLLLCCVSVEQGKTQTIERPGLVHSASSCHPDVNVGTDLQFLAFFLHGC